MNNKRQLRDELVQIRMAKALIKKLESQLNNPITPSYMDNKLSYLNEQEEKILAILFEKEILQGASDVRIKKERTTG